MTPGIAEQVLAALDAATKENDYPHDYERPAHDIVAEIYEQSGIEGYDPENRIHAHIAELAVTAWRTENPKESET